MRRLGFLLTVLLVCGPALAVPAAVAAEKAETSIDYAIVVDEGPAPPSGTRFRFDAVLRAGDDPVAGAVVVLFGRSYGETSYKALGQATSNQDGRVVVSTVLRRSTVVQWSYAGDDERAASVSHPYTRTVSSRVVARVSDRTPAVRQGFVVTGRSFPAKPGYRVSLWTGSVPCFCLPVPTRRLAVATVRADGTYRLVGRFPNPGKKQLFVKVNGGGGTSDGYSPYFHVRVHR